MLKSMLMGAAFMIMLYACMDKKWSVAYYWLLVTAYWAMQVFKGERL